MRLAIVFAALALCGAQGALAQNLTGAWQGTIGSRQYVLKAVKDGSGPHGEFFHLGEEVSGETLNGNPISAISVNGKAVKFELDRSPGTFEGTLAADGKSIAGTWTGRGQPQPITFTRTTKDAWTIDPSPHKAQFVPVEKDVRLEVLDWGGSGPPLVFIPGHGNTAHVFDSLAPKFTATHHVYAVTRRGFGVSSWPAPADENYDADRLGDDVLAVIDALKLNRPVVAGHSLAGEELSSISTRHPEKVAGLIYLDASYPYAFYSPEIDTLGVDSSVIRRNLLAMQNAPPSQARAMIEELRVAMPRLQNRLDMYYKDIEQRPDGPSRPMTLRTRVSTAILQNFRKYTNLKGPILAIVAPPECGTTCADAKAKAREEDLRRLHDAFAAANPSARVVRLPNANHYVWRSNEADVLREMNAFLAEVAQAPARAGR